MQAGFLFLYLRVKEHPEGVLIFAIVEIHSIQIIVVDKKLDDAFGRERGEGGQFCKIYLRQKKEFASVGCRRPADFRGQVGLSPNLTFPEFGFACSLRTGPDKRLFCLLELFAEGFEDLREFKFHKNE